MFCHYFIQTAVVSALKGLQEKIRKLELERADAEDNLKKLATESRHYKDVLQKELTVRESSQGVIAKQNQRRLQFNVCVVYNNIIISLLHVSLESGILRITSRSCAGKEASLACPSVRAALIYFSHQCFFTCVMN